MAFPQITTRVSGQDSVASTLHPIIWLSGLSVDELIYGMAAVYYDTFGVYSKSLNFQLTDEYESPTNDTNVIAFGGKALGGTNDYLTLSTSGSCIVRWVYYKISNHGVVTFTDLDGEFNNGSTSGFITPYCPDPDDSIVQDYLWLNFVAYDGICTTLNAPSGFANVQHNSRTDTDQISVAGSDREYNGSQITTSTWVNSPSTFDFVTHTLRIPWGTYGSSVDPGIGFYTSPRYYTDIYEPPS